MTGLLYSIPLITIGAASVFGWMLAYLRGPAVVSEWIAQAAGNDPFMIMLLLVVLFVIVGDFIDAIPAIIIFMPIITDLTKNADINPVHMGVVIIVTLAFGLITPPYGLCAADGVEIHRCALRQGDGRVAADLHRVLRRHRLLHLSSRTSCCGCPSTCCRNRSAASRIRAAPAISAPEPRRPEIAMPPAKTAISAEAQGAARRLRHPYAHLQSALSEGGDRQDPGA